MLTFRYHLKGIFLAPLDTIFIWLDMTKKKRFFSHLHTTAFAIHNLKHPLYINLDSYFFYVLCRNYERLARYYKDVKQIDA